jgi:hypothetical protein
LYTSVCGSPDAGVINGIMRSSYFIAAGLAAITVLHAHAQQTNTAPAAAARVLDPKTEARIGALKTEGAA